MKRGKSVDFSGYRRRHSAARAAPGGVLDLNYQAILRSANSPLGGEVLISVKLMYPGIEQFSRQRFPE
jgi:hypothetical protein